MIIDAARPTSATVTTLGVAEPDADEVAHLLSTAAQSAVAGTAGFAGGAWFIEIVDNQHPQTPGVARVVQYLQWRNRTGADALPLNPADLATLHPAIHDRTTRTYRLDTVVSADQRHRALLERQSDPAAAPFTSIITITPTAGKQAWLNEYNQSETRDYIRHLDGFVFACFYAAPRSEHLTEIVQWRSAQDFSAALTDDRFTEHITVANHYSASEQVDYRVHSASNRDDGEFRTAPARNGGLR